jgi:hypothetical protein
MSTNRINAELQGMWKESLMPYSEEYPRRQLLRFALCPRIAG